MSLVIHLNQEWQPRSHDPWQCFSVNLGSIFTEARGGQESSAWLTRLPTGNLKREIF